jgi:hypothetical protein
VGRGWCGAVRGVAGEVGKTGCGSLKHESKEGAAEFPSLFTLQPPLGVREGRVTLPQPSAPWNPPRPSPLAPRSPSKPFTSRLPWSLCAATMAFMHSKKSASLTKPKWSAARANVSCARGGRAGGGVRAAAGDAGRVVGVRACGGDGRR